MTHNVIPADTAKLALSKCALHDSAHTLLCALETSPRYRGPSPVNAEPAPPLNAAHLMAHVQSMYASTCASTCATQCSTSRNTSPVSSSLSSDDDDDDDDFCDHHALSSNSIATHSIVRPIAMRPLARRGPKRMCLGLGGGQIKVK